MQKQPSAIRAVIDIGSNTIEVLVARCLPGDLEIIEHQATMARLGESVDESGELSRDKFDTALQALRKYNEIHISSHGVREGALLAYTRYGEHWLEEVKSIASGRGKSQADQRTVY
jgi:exopolyphosphatase/pppGpp-phosphohydrolase